MSSIRRNSYGYFFLDLRVNGKRERITLDTKDRKLASVRATLELKARQQRVRYSRITVDEFLTLYLEWCKPRRAETTYKNYVSIKKRLLTEIGIKYIDEIDRQQAEGLIIRLAATMTARGVNYYLRALKAFFHLAVDWQYLPTSPFKDIQKLREPTLRPRVLKRSELVNLFKIIQKDYPEYLELFVVYLLTGIRRNEALEIKQTDVDFQNDTITIHGKGDKYRLVPMLPAVKRIFHNRRSLPKPFAWNGSTITHVFIKARKTAKIEGVKLHDLRKTFGTMLADHGFSSLLITQWLGHADDEVTRTHYIGFNDLIVKKKMKAFQRDLLTVNIPKRLLAG